VHDKKGEYPVSDELPMYEDTSLSKEYIKSCNVGVLEALDKYSIFVATLVEAYWYNVNPSESSSELELDLSERELELINYRYIQGIPIKDIPQYLVEDVKPNALYQSVHRLKRKLLKKIKNNS